MPAGQLELLVEPFKENDPGPHVEAVLKVVAERGFSHDMGPFSTTVDGELDDLFAILSDVMTAGFEAGATSIQARVQRR